MTNRRREVAHLGEEEVELARQARLAVLRSLARKPVVAIAQKVGPKVRVGEERLENDAHVAAVRMAKLAREPSRSRGVGRTCCRDFGCPVLQKGV